MEKKSNSLIITQTVRIAYLSIALTLKANLTPIQVIQTHPSK